MFLTNELRDNHVGEKLESPPEYLPSMQRLFDARIAFNGRAKTVKWDDRTIKLTPLEFKLLRLLVSRPDTTLSRQFIVDKIWRHGAHPVEYSVDALIYRIRRKLFRGPCLDPIRSVLGVGYRFEATVRIMGNSNYYASPKKIKLRQAIEI
jgi:DNA-binding response OmpR family regulator